MFLSLFGHVTVGYRITKIIVSLECLSHHYDVFLTVGPVPEHCQRLGQKSWLYPFCVCVTARKDIMWKSWDLSRPSKQLTIYVQEPIYSFCISIPAAPQSSEPAESETSGGSRASSLRTFSDRMRRMTCTYEPNTDLHTRMVVRRASINRRESMRRDTAVEGYSAPRYRRDTAVEGYSAPKSSSLATHRLSKPRAFVRPYAVASIVGLKERAPSPLTLDDIGSGRDFIEDGGDVERGEGGGFVGPAAYDPVSPDATDFADKTQVMLLR